MIRRATPNDVDAIVDLMLLAMGDLPYQFANTNDKKIAFELLKKFVLEKENQYSLENIFVAELNKEIAGTIVAYDGAKTETLRKPFFEYISTRFHSNAFKMELESKAGEFYIDTLSVDPKFQGKGIGKLLINTVIIEAKRLGFKRVGLLVSSTNPNAKRLYEKVGFKVAGYKNLLEATHEHLVFDL